MACAGCGKVTQVPVPCAREGSRFTLLFEALTLMLAPTMSVLAAGRLLRVRSRRRWRVFDHQVRQERAGERHAGVRAIDVDDAGGKSNASGFLLAAGAEAQVPGDEPVVQETFGRLVGERQVGVVQWLHDCGVVLEDLTAELAEIGESLPVGSEAFYRWQGMVHRQARSFHAYPVRTGWSGFAGF